MGEVHWEYYCNTWISWSVTDVRKWKEQHQIWDGARPRLWDNRQREQRLLIEATDWWSAMIRWCWPLSLTTEFSCMGGAWESPINPKAKLKQFKGLVWQRRKLNLIASHYLDTFASKGWSMLPSIRERRHNKSMSRVEKDQSIGGCEEYHEEK